MLTTKLGSYEITRELGQGGMGKVYLARHTLLGKQAAVKVLLPKLSGNAEVVERFFNEARAATMIEHRGIIDVYDFGYCDDGSAYIVMEFLDGETLTQRIESRGTLPQSVIVTLAGQVAGALAAAHAAGIIHRDLKPDNVFLIADPEVVGGERVKVLDFGIAKLAVGDDDPSPDGSTFVRTQTGAVMGSPLYMAPEQCKGAGDVDARADIYALGCVMYHMATGRPPFLGDGLGDIIAKHIYEPPAPARTHNPEVSRALEALIARTLQKQPDRRYASMAELRSALDSLGRARSDGGVAALAATDPALAVAATGTGSTTLGAAAGAVAIRPRRERSLGWVALGGTTVVIAGIAVAVALMAGKDDAPARRAAAPPPAITADAAAEVTPPALDAAVAAEPPAPATIHVRLTSKPPGAEVFRKADGVRLGTTPFVDELPRGAGELVLVLRKDGHEPEEVVVPLAADHAALVTLHGKRGASRPSPRVDAGVTAAPPPAPPDAAPVEKKKPRDRAWGDTVDPLGEGD